MITLLDFLKQKDCDPSMHAIVVQIAQAGTLIRDEIHITATKKDRLQNATGDTQSALDITTDKIIRKALERSDYVSTAASEEQDEIYHLEASKGKYFVAYDPYDGGSVGDTNISFGSIFGIWTKNPLNKKVGADLVAACYLLYGPRVIFVLSLRGSGTHFFELNNDKIFYLVKQDLVINKDAHHFAPGNLRASAIDKKYRTVIDHWLSSAYTLRYTGAFVTDVNHILLKGDGIFTYPAEDKYPTGRLRLLYECAPLTMIVQEAGGSGTTQYGNNILSEEITGHHQRTSIVIGSHEEVQKVCSLMKNHPANL